jgi:DNA-binding protein H-NS
MCVDESMVVPAAVAVVETKTALPTLNDVLGNAGVPELLDAKTTVDELLKARVAKENESMKAAISAIAQATGVTVEKVLETLTPEKTKRKAKTDAVSRPVVVKFRHPENSELTWTGRGKEPKWLQEARNEFDDQELLAA